ncbi:MAG: hypothetical protein HXX08_08520 [Chloroflexi bacterium]|uniref:Uncharacterized protein n=1 Tax=Candidatus Chlorohelix allophototropha TaxID=3003348 RepID=A0A8T7LV55_9CHLR|nr:hypothetical protein [Chloroflexota bacterium]WJW67769.1 hypothetical protein OZ401_001048 [Chloroflexota bacterium L227-S17]
MEKLDSKRIEALGDLAFSEHHEHLETDDSQFPYMLLVIMGVSVVAIGVMLVLFFGLGNEVVTQTLGTHFQKR